MYISNACLMQTLFHSVKHKPVPLYLHLILILCCEVSTALHARTQKALQVGYFQDSEGKEFCSIHS